MTWRGYVRRVGMTWKEGVNDVEEMCMTGKERWKEGVNDVDWKLNECVNDVEGRRKEGGHDV